MSNNVQLTQKGLETLKKELTDLVEEKRPIVVARLERARNEGDLSENSDYINAKDELEFLDGRIDEIKQVIDSAEIVESNGSSNKVSVGTMVTLTTNGTEHTFEIVGDWEADPMKKKISLTSPLGQALMDRRPGDRVEVEAPAGKINYEIINIE